MTKEKIESHIYFNREDQVKRYESVYGNPDFQEKYPQNKQRLSIFIDLLLNIGPDNVIDAGCGAGLPLVHILDNKINAQGYDKSAGYDAEKAQIGDFENPKHLKDSSVDCITGMGAFYYANNFTDTLKNQTQKLKEGGHMIFSLRNRLFDLSTLNEYTERFLFELFEVKNFDNDVQDEFKKQFKDNNISGKKFSTVDDSNVMSNFHNPLTVKEEVLEPVGLDLKGIYFYHFHALPPVFEHTRPEEFRSKSWQMENPLDWRGHFLASCFIVHTVKR
jgi:SAM-dependent methyltransferase